MVTPFIFPTGRWLIMRAASQGRTAPLYSTLKTSEVKCQTFESFHWVEELLFGVVNITYWKASTLKMYLSSLLNQHWWLAAYSICCVLDAGEQFFYSKITVHLCPPWSFVNQPREVYQENKRILDNMPGNQYLWLT